jgi:hypothetical protein
MAVGTEEDEIFEPVVVAVAVDMLKGEGRDRGRVER